MLLMWTCEDAQWSRATPICSGAYEQPTSRAIKERTISCFIAVSHCSCGRSSDQLARDADILRHERRLGSALMDRFFRAALRISRILTSSALIAEEVEHGLMKLIGLLEMRNMACVRH
jgi:hypothetical protein